MRKKCLLNILIYFCFNPGIYFRGWRCQCSSGWVVGDVITFWCNSDAFFVSTSWYILNADIKFEFWNLKSDFNWIFLKKRPCLDYYLLLKNVIWNDFFNVCVNFRFVWRFASYGWLCNPFATHSIVDYFTYASPTGILR